MHEKESVQGYWAHSFILRALVVVRPFVRKILGFLGGDIFEQQEKQKEKESAGHCSRSCNVRS